MIDLEAKWLWLSMQSYGFKIISWVKAFETQPSNFTNLRTLSLRRRHKLLSHWNFRLRICPPKCHMEGCICICTSLKQNYIYIICICKKNKTVPAMPGLGMANLDEHTSKQDFKDKVGRRIQYTYVMQCKTHILYWSVQKPGKAQKNQLKQSWSIHGWEGFESHALNTQLPWFATPERPSLSTKKCQINFKTRGGEAFNKYQNTIHGRSATIVSLKSSPSWKRN